MRCITRVSPRPFAKLPSFALVLTVIAAFVSGSQSGCRQDDGIKVYNVEKTPESASKDLIPVEPSSAPPAWFFKLTGGSDEVLKQIVPFSQVVKSLIFDPKGNPHYDVPEGWNQSDGPAPRYQTLKIAGSEPELEVTVSSLPGPSNAYDKYLLANVNRWRGQLNLPPYEGEEGWFGEARSKGELTLVPSSAFIVAMVNLVGEVPDKGEQRILGAIVLLPPEGTTQVAPANAPIANAKPPFEFKMPEGWKTSAGNAMRLASLEAKHDAGKVDVSVSKLSGGGEPLANVNRWRGEVKLEPFSKEELEKETTNLEISGKPATYYEIAGPEETTLAAIVEDGDAKWFFKARGPKEAVAAEKKHFEEFLKSVKFEK